MTSPTSQMINFEQLSSLPPAVLAKVGYQANRALEKRARENKLSVYSPYEKQREFHAAGAKFRERLLSAGNQNGKTWAGAAECAMHATGYYPSWWTGRRFDRPIVIWSGGVTYDLLRDSVQKLLLGGWQKEDRGTGTLPKHTIQSVTPSRGVPEMADTIYVTHHDKDGRPDGKSTIRLKAYEQGRTKWQAGTVHLVWFDEEPPASIYTEGLSRLNATGGCSYMTFTPLLGMSDVASRFFMEDSPDRHLTRMTINDALHISAEEREKIARSYRAYELEARLNGMPSLGSGRVFPIAQSAIEIESFQIPKHWPRIAGVDFGWDHPAAGAWLAWDRDNDIVYVTDCYRAREQTAVLNALTLKGRGAWIPIAWPADGNAHDKGSGEALAAQYRAAGANMMFEHATLDPNMGAKSSVSVEAGVDEILTRMQTGRFRVFSHLTEWWQEFHLYHRLDGQIVKERDDILSATRYAMMMLRHATTESSLEVPIPRRMGWAVR